MCEGVKSIIGGIFICLKRKLSIRTEAADEEGTNCDALILKGKMSHSHYNIKPGSTMVKLVFRKSVGNRIYKRLKEDLSTKRNDILKQCR